MKKRIAAFFILPKTLTLDLGKGVSMKLVRIPAGKFLMGSPKTEVGRDGDEAQREVTINRSFLMGVYEVTQNQWRMVMGTRPWGGMGLAKAGDRNACSYINWGEANEFCQKLSKTTGEQVALPSEAQWEYACRAGSRAAYSFGDDSSKLGDYAWYMSSKSGKYAHPVGQKKANAFGLYDMHGNVYEWCADWSTDGFTRVLRGGSWLSPSRVCRAADRCGLLPIQRFSNIGFRVIVSGVDVD